MVGDDQLVGGTTAHHVSDLPETGRPDFAVGVYLANQITRILLIAVQTTQRWRVIAAVGDGIPGADAWLESSRLRIGEEAAREVIAECLAHRATLGAGPESGYLVVLDGVTVLMKDDLGVLCIVHATRAEPERFRERAIVGVVVIAADDIDLDGSIQHV